MDILILLLLLTPLSRLAAQTYTIPASERTNILLDANWRFIRQDAPGAQTNGFDDSTWTNLSLPHTWNNLDGQDGGNNYYRGIGWYRVHFTPDASYTNRELFLKFDGANIVSDVYVNGAFVGEHQGGFAAFVFDITTNLVLGADNVIAVEVNNASNANIPPLSADFTFFGGIYRDVHVLVTDPVQISPLDYGSPGVYLKPTGVSSASANLQVTTVVSNATPAPATVTVRAVIADAATNIVTTLTNVVTVPAASVSNVVASAVLANPHLWNGLADPYLYQAFVEIYNGTNLTDWVGQPLGFRFFSVDPTNGFFLNGSHYDLHGVSVHQDWLNCGWALTNAQRATNFMFLKEMGVTAYRMAHYQKNDYEYQLADQNGIVLWSEIPLVNSTTENTAFYNNAKQQLRELIRQNFNHPAVVCWGMYNELTIGLSTALVGQLVQLEAQEDPTRPSTAAVLASSNGDTNAFTPNLVAFNEYFGWYESPLNGLASWADTIHAAHPTNCIGISEYGAGASIYQHSEDPVAMPGTSGAPFHPEEWQNIVHETNWAELQARPFIWCKFLWNMFNFAADARNEGDTPGRNDKGLVTYDRLVRKDAFYFYKANWTTNPMVYITGHTFTNRTATSITAKVYANCDSVQLYVNGVSQGSIVRTNHIFTWPVTLLAGSNYVQAVGVKGASNVTDSLFWIAPSPPPIVLATSPASGIAYLNGTSDVLQLSVNVTNPAASPLTTTWSQLGGPGTVTFGSSNAAATTAAFSANGIYSLNFNAYNGGATNVPFAVVVGPFTGVTNGLLAWWKMNESGGSTAADSSGNGRTATNSNAFFTNYTSGFPTNALHLNGTSSFASFASPAVTQITVTAWARASAHGNSAYPRIFDTPGYRLFFRFDNQGTNGFDFATYSTGNGDWFSGANTIATGAWYHVAASYDLSNLSGVPVEYLNGQPIASPGVITTPSGTQPSSAGTGYIGNLAALTRAWSGDLSDLRIYSRILTGGEIQLIANSQNAVYAPSVNAGTNQTVVWPATIGLAGTATGATATAWSALSGPGAVTFANSNALSTTAVFSMPGAYQLQLAASNSAATTVSTLTVNAIKPSLAVSQLSNTLQLSWPASASNWLLQYQSNPPLSGLGTNWTILPGPATNPFAAPFNSNAGSIFYRLVHTN